MNDIPDAAPRPWLGRIRARIHDSALQRVTRLWAATTIDTLVESFQNGRRAGATRVSVIVTDPAGEPSDNSALTVTVTDDGIGIADPAVLLSLGETGWDGELAGREDAAGMGFASHARQGCRIASRSRSDSGKPGPGWRVDLTPAHFLGEEEATVVPEDGGSWPHGTAVSFTASGDRDSIRRAVEAAARHYPLPVTLDGETVPRRAFLDGAVDAEPWRGLVFGVFVGRSRGCSEPDLNFHGLTLPVRLPTVDPVTGQTWSIRAEVASCPELELVLPARKEAVETPFLNETREAARLAVYRAMASTEAPPRIAFEDWTRAREAGIELPIPSLQLRPWRPCIADIDDWREAPALASVSNDALVMHVDPEPPESQALWRAAEHGGMTPRLFEADRRLDGYGWYDALPRVTDVRTEIVTGGEARPLEDYRTPSEGSSPIEPPPRPDWIRICLDVEGVNGKTKTLDLDADLAFSGEAWVWLPDAKPLVTAGSALEPAELAELLRAAYFSPSDEADSDSWETQRLRFDEEAMHIAVKLLCSADEARRTSITEAVRRELFWLIPRDREVTIAVRGREVSVELGAVRETAG